MAPLIDIAELCARHGARLMVDEAHAAGVLGARGAGTAELFGVEDLVDLRMGTFSKSLASCGGFIAGPADVVEYLRISSRAFLFTASGVPAALGAALAALRIIRSAEGPALLAAVLENARYFAEGLRGLGFLTLAGEPRADRSGERRARDASILRSSRSQIEEDWKAALLWRALYDEGVFTNCALHPAVPPGKALLRMSVMATHDRAILDRALEIFRIVKGRFEAEHGPLPVPRPPSARLEAAPDRRRLSSRLAAGEVEAVVHFTKSPLLAHVALAQAVDPGWPLRIVFR